MTGKDNYQLLIQKLDQFIRKYYTNQMIRGSLYSLGLILMLFLVFNILEYYFYFPSGVRKLLFWSFIGISGVALTGWVIQPMMKYFRLGKIISHEQAAAIVGGHFTNVKDKLLNILQLKQQSDQLEDPSLVLASVDQKAEEIKPVPFQSAINFGQNRKYLPYALPPLLVLLILLLAAPSIIRDSTIRLINNDRDFERPAPFYFVVDNRDLDVVQYEDFPLTVKVNGDQLPEEVYIDIEDYQYRLTKESPNTFTYQFRNVQKDVKFRFFSAGVQSETYELSVLRKPNILGFDVKLDYPAYTGREDEKLSSIGDLVVPAGTKIDWVFNAENTDDIWLAFSGDEKQVAAKRFANDLFSYSKRAIKDERYQLIVSNGALPKADSIMYSLSVVPDAYPDISAEQFVDSTDTKMRYFAGEASDDYGILNLTFNYRIKKAEGGQLPLQTTPIGKPSGNRTEFQHAFDIDLLELEAGDEVTYYFEVADNDGVNGSKTSRTNLMVFAKPTAEEYAAMAEENNEKVKDNLQKAMEESKKIQEEMRRMREKLLQENELNWQNRKELENLLERQEELKKQVEEAQKAFEENLKNQEEFSEIDEETLRKQEKMQELFEELYTEEMQELMEKIKDLLQELEKDDAIKMAEEMEFNNEEMEKEMERLEELYKQLELERDIKQAIDELEKLAEKEEQLSEETKEEAAPQEELEKEQQDINEQFEDLKEKMENIQQKNQELETPQQMGDRQEDMEKIQQDLNQSQQQLQQQQNQKASESQKKASEKMRDMAEAIQMEMQQNQMEQMQEDMQALRQLLENLVGLSFDQEDLIDQFMKSEINTPRYVELVQEQFKLEDDFRLIEDSLQALSKRVFQIESFVTEKVTDIKHHMKYSLEDLEERRLPQANDHQQRTMTNTNDLALMLSEVMNQMQQEMSSMMAGSQMCTKPGSQNEQGQPKDKISQGQQQLNQQMQKMRQGQKDGQMPNSEEFARMAARQAALRRALEEKQKQLREQGKGEQGLQDVIDQMDKTETDLVNKRLTNEILKRQQEIMTRLLEHEEAERQQKMEKQRESRTAEEKPRELPPELQEYLKERASEVEMYKSVSPELKPYYKFLVEEYLKSLKVGDPAE